MEKTYGAEFGEFVAVFFPWFHDGYQPGRLPSLWEDSFSKAGVVCMYVCNILMYMSVCMYVYIYLITYIYVHSCMHICVYAYVFSACMYV